MTVSVMSPARHSAVGAQSAGMIRAGVYGAESHWAGCGCGGDGLHTRAIGVGHQDEQHERNSNEGCEEIARGFRVDGGKSHIVFLSCSRKNGIRCTSIICRRLHKSSCVAVGVARISDFQESIPLLYACRLRVPILGNPIGAVVSAPAS